MAIEFLPLVCFAILVVAFLYSSVGHAGASGYIAVMSLLAIDPLIIKPAALVLNIVVATLSAWQFWKAGYFSWKLFWPFAIASIPFAFMGGYLTLPISAFKIVIGIMLIYSALQFLIHPAENEEPRDPEKPVSIAVGAGIGFLSGLTGVGGGILLSPLMIFMKWAKIKTASATSALFILVNSISGLSGNIAGTKQLPLFAFPLVLSAIVGGSIGSYLGSRRFSPVVIKRLLAVVLIIGGIKMLI